MNLFNKDSSADEYYEFEQIRSDFTRENIKMRGTVKKKIEDPENIKYDRLHVEIYKGSGVGESWTVEEAKNSQEIKIATGGFKHVTKSLSPYPDKSIKSNKLLELIRFFFRRKNDIKK
ncbi:MAG: hypothetical protein H7A23_17935 [Leptospiraceae bacterium]|nr:hypothetical protein [Leptospiraceae bacterium]MCP5496431.1 hypothetical protein [Leptospiraceae bacterium]